MNSSWLAEEIEEDLKKNKLPPAKVIILLFAVLLIGSGAYALASKTSDRSDMSSATPSIASPTPSAVAVPSLSSTPVPQPVVNTIIIAPTPYTPSMAVIKAELCKSVITTAQEAAKRYDTQFSDSWKSWISDFAGRFDSSEAEASKQFYKGFTRNMFIDYIKSNDPTMRTACESTTSLENIMLQPNYDAWQ